MNLYTIPLEDIREMPTEALMSDLMVANYNRWHFIDLLEGGVVSKAATLEALEGCIQNSWQIADELKRRGVL